MSFYATQSLRRGFLEMLPHKICLRNKLPFFPKREEAFESERKCLALETLASEIGHDTCVSMRNFF